MKSIDTIFHLIEDIRLDRQETWLAPYLFQFYSHAQKINSEQEDLASQNTSILAENALLVTEVFELKKRHAAEVEKLNARIRELEEKVLQALMTRSAGKSNGN